MLFRSVIASVSLFIVIAGAQESDQKPQTAEKHIASKSRIAYVPGYRLAEWLKHYKAAEQKDRNTSYYHVGKAWGFIAGVMDTASEEIIIQDKLTMKQVVNIVDSFLAEHIDRWHEPAADIVIDALKENVVKVKANEIK